MLLFSNLSFCQNIDSLLHHLEFSMEKHDYYDKQKKNRIDSLLKERNKINSQSRIFMFNNEIFEEYQFYSFNKALHYIEENIQIAKQQKDNLLLNQAKLKLAILLVHSGRYKESIDVINDIHRKSLSKTSINDYYTVFSEGYSWLSYNTIVSSSKSSYTQQYHAYQDSLYSRLKPNSEEALRIKEKEYRDNRNLAMAFKINSQRLSKVKDGSRLFSLVTFERSLLYELNNNSTQQKKYLILSALSDIKASVKDNASMGTLAKILFTEGDIGRAHRYINFSYNDAEFYNSKLRFLDIANIMPLITKAYERKIHKQKQKQEYSLIFTSVLVILLLITIYIIYKQVKKISRTRNELKVVNKNLRKLNIKLSELDEIKEHYIGSFLNLCSEYITKLDAYRKLVRKYVKANRINALLKLSKPNKQLIDEELEIFNKIFDSSFLHMHPNFVESVNKLLKPSKQIILEDASKLNTELRILALIKLGINSSSRIAKNLRYSVNTIYNYRAAIKNNSIDKLTFEGMVKKIF